MLKTKYGDYQTESRKTYGHVHTKDDPIIYPALGLVNEAGEVAGKIKKVFRDKDGEFDEVTTKDLKAELGDVLWYLSQISTNLGLTLEEIAEYNLEKIFSRKKRNVLRGSGDNR